MASAPTAGRPDWQRVEALFHEALARRPGQREAFLAEACADDDETRREVVSLLEAHDRDGARLEAGGLAVAARLVAGAESAIEDPPPASCPAMRRRASPPLWLGAVALIFFADCLLRTWCYVAGPERLGYAPTFEGGRMVVGQVRRDSAAGLAGLRVGDEVLAIDNLAPRSPADWRVVGWNLEVGRTYRHDVRRGSERLRVDLVARRVRVLENPSVGVHAVWNLDALFLNAIALFIAFARPYDRLARLGALALAVLSVGLYSVNMPPGYAAVWRGLPAPLAAPLWIPNLGIFLLGPIILTFFAQFPRPVFRSRWPWFIVWAPAVPLLMTCVVSAFDVVYRPARAMGAPVQEWGWVLPNAVFALYGLAALAALVVNYSTVTEVNEKRRLRTVLVSGAAGVLPGLLRWPLFLLAPDSRLLAALGSPLPDFLIAVVFLLFPIGFAYATVRHRLFDIRVIVRMGLQYAAARGLVTLVVPALVAGLAVDVLLHGEQPVMALVRERGWVYALIALAAGVAHLRRAQWSEAIDRRFFREQYDARRVLGGVVEQVRAFHSFTGAVPGVLARVAAALHPEFAAVLVRSAGSDAFRTIAATPPGHPVPQWPTDGLRLDALRLRHPPSATEGGTHPEGSVDLVVPIVLSADSDEAVMTLGPRRSQEPYSREDRRLLEAIASGLAVLFEQEVLVSLSPSRGFEECPDCGTCSDSGSGSCAVDGAALTLVPLPRTFAGRYRLERRCGRGGMGTVYEARDTTLGRKVAVKVIREELVTSASAVRRFSREARVAASFGHVNVVTVYDFGVEAGTRAFLVMELLEGETLRDAIRGQGALGPARALEILRPVCDAVGAAHRRQLIHRDLKPENIFLCRGRRADGASVKILDFGVAKILGDGSDVGDAGGGTETAIGVLVGTPAYMPPEQVLGERPAVAWDLWALTVVAYEILTGAVPFPVADREGWMRALLSGAYVPLHERLPGAPGSWRDFFAGALAVDRTVRPASASDFLLQFEDALAGQ